MALTVADIRLYLKDTTEFNLLLEGDYQSSTELITLAMTFAAMDYNITPPLLGEVTPESFPNDSLLLLGVKAHLASSEAERQLRNQINHSAQGLQTGIDDKQPQYSQLAQTYKMNYLNLVAKYKQAVNMDAAWGSVSSPYAQLPDERYSS